MALYAYAARFRRRGFIYAAHGANGGAFSAARAAGSLRYGLSLQKMRARAVLLQGGVIRRKRRIRVKRQGRYRIRRYAPRDIRAE